MSNDNQENCVPRTRTYGQYPLLIPGLFCTYDTEVKNKEIKETYNKIYQRNNAREGILGIVGDTLNAIDFALPHLTKEDKKEFHELFSQLTKEFSNGTK